MVEKKTTLKIKLQEVCAIIKLLFCGIRSFNKSFLFHFYNKKRQRFKIIYYCLFQIFCNYNRAFNFIKVNRRMSRCYILKFMINYKKNNIF